MKRDEAFEIMLGHFCLYGRYPSDTQLGAALGVSRQRGEQLINELAKVGKIKFSDDGSLGYDYRPLLIKHDKAIRKAWLKDKYGMDVLR